MGLGTSFERLKETGDVREIVMTGSMYEGYTPPAYYSSNQARSFLEENEKRDEAFQTEFKRLHGMNSYVFEIDKYRYMNCTEGQLPIMGLLELMSRKNKEFVADYFENYVSTLDRSVLEKITQFLMPENPHVTLRNFGCCAVISFTTFDIRIIQEVDPDWVFNSVDDVLKLEHSHPRPDWRKYHRSARSSFPESWW